MTYTSGLIVQVEHESFQTLCRGEVRVGEGAPRCTYAQGIDVVGASMVDFWTCPSTAMYESKNVWLRPVVVYTCLCSAVLTVVLQYTVMTKV